MTREPASPSMTTSAVFHCDLGQVEIRPVFGVVKPDEPQLAGKVEQQKGVVAGFGNVLRGKGVRVTSAIKAEKFQPFPLDQKTCVHVACVHVLRVALAHCAIFQ